jgi:TetR/AcrR family transcriptional repressor of nem operon
LGPGGLADIIHIQDDACHPPFKRNDRRIERSTVGSSQTDKAASHERIVKVASRRIRRDGISNVAVADLMKEAGLTHGGFYRHFDSREELVAEAVDAALAQGSRRFKTADARGRSALIDGYLSPLHRDRPETGCAVAALPTEIARTGPRARSAYTLQVRRYLDLLDELPPGCETDEACLILASLVGALALARAVDDRGLSDQILGSTARALHRHLEHTELF